MEPGTVTRSLTADSPLVLVRVSGSGLGCTGSHDRWILARWAARRLEFALLLPPAEILKLSPLNLTMLLEQLPGLGVTERRRRAFVAIGSRTLHPIDRVAGDSVVLAQLIEQRRGPRAYG